MTAIHPIPIIPSRRKQAEERTTTSETDYFRSLAGAMIWAGSVALPQAAYVGSAMQQRIPNLRLKYRSDPNGIIKELKDLKPVITFPKPEGKTKSVSIRSFSDASFNIGTNTQFGQTGIITGLEYGSYDGDKVYHMVDLASLKQKTVIYSSYGAEILACTEADDRGYNNKMALHSITHGKAKVQHIFNIDSKGLYDTITTLHEGREYRLRQTVQRIRDSFEAGDLDVLRWVQGSINVADALTKRNPVMHRILNRIAYSGRLILPTHKSQELHSSEWV